MDEAEKRRIIEEGWATLDHLDELLGKQDQPADTERDWPRAPDPLRRSNAGMDRWRAEARDWEVKCERAREAHAQQERRAMHERKAQSDAEWNAWADTKIAAAIKQFAQEYSEEVVEVVFSRMDKHKSAADAKLTKTLGQVVAELRQQLRDEIDAKVRELREEIIMKRITISPDNTVIDMPSPLIRKVKDNAA